jgi:hypothetical protein
VRSCRTVIIRGFIDPPMSPPSANSTAVANRGGQHPVLQRPGDDEAEHEREPARQAVADGPEQERPRVDEQDHRDQRGVQQVGDHDDEHHGGD